MPKIRCICQRCGAPFERYPSQIRPGGTFCSRRCHNVKTGEQRTCPTCGISFYVNRSTIEKGEGIYCSRRCGNAARGRSGPSNGNWKGGRFQRSDGYIAVAVGEGKYRLEHDLVMEEHIGRRLHQGENVHHENRIRDDNQLENLELKGWSVHIKEDHPRQKEASRWALVNCESPLCGKMFPKRKSQLTKTKHNFCCRDCYREGRRRGIA